MMIQDNVLKAYLKNVYFITGTPCGGKTTVTRALAERHALAVYDVDEAFDRHQSCSDPRFQPSMNRTFRDADEFFGRTVEEYRDWLVRNTREQLDFVLLDLIYMARDRTVLCDCHLTVEETDRITDPSRVVFLLKDPADLIEDYCNRPDHAGFRNYIHSASDVARAKATCGETLRTLNENRYRAIKASRYFWLERDENSTVEDTVRKVERHFGW